MELNHPLLRRQFKRIRQWFNRAFFEPSGHDWDYYVPYFNPYRRVCRVCGRYEIVECDATETKTGAIRLTNDAWVAFTDAESIPGLTEKR